MAKKNFENVGEVTSDIDEILKSLGDNTGLRIGQVEREFGSDIVGTDMTLLVRECAETKGLLDSYPFMGDPTPVRVISDDHQFYTVLVLPHKHSGRLGASFAVSTPYRVSVPKFGLRCGYFQLTEKRR